MDPSGGKKNNSIPSFRRDSRIVNNGSRSIIVSQGRGSNSDGVDPALRVKTIEIMKAGRIARERLSSAINGAGGTAKRLGGTAAAASTSILNTNDDNMSDSSRSEYNYDNVRAVGDNNTIDLVNGEDDSDDDNSDKHCDVLAIKPGKGKPLFHLLSGDVMRVMTDKVKGNYANGNPNVTSADELKNMLGTVVEKRAFFLKVAGVLDTKMEVADVPTGTTICSLLLSKIPNSFPVKLTKTKVAAALVDIWAILAGVLPTNMLRRGDTHDLQKYFGFMVRVELLTKRELEMDSTVAKDIKTINLDDEMMQRCFLVGGGYAPPPLFNTCAKCGHRVVDEPKENKKAAKQTATFQKQWLADSQGLIKWKNNEGGPLLDKKGKTMTKVPSPKVLPEYIICHCWQQMESIVAAGEFSCYYKCLVNGIQYDIGKCPHCLCDCSFVVAKS